MVSNATPELNEASFKFFFSVLKHCEEIKPDWQAVAEENSIKYARNVSPRFKEILKKMGYALEGGKIVELGAAPATPKQSTKGKKNGTTSNKKRKVKEVDDEDDVIEEDRKVKVNGKDDGDEDDE